MRHLPVTIGATTSHRTAQLFFAGWAAVAAVVFLVLVIYMIANYSKIRGSRSRFEVLERLLGRRRARLFGFACLGWGALSLILLAVLHPG